MGRARFVLKFGLHFLFQVHAFGHRQTVRNLAAKALIASARPLAGTLSAGSLAAKALIAAARA
jgi:hypothetical protein